MDLREYNRLIRASMKVIHQYGLSEELRPLIMDAVNEVGGTITFNDLERVAE